MGAVARMGLSPTTFGRGLDYMLRHYLFGEP
jgi:hypothetical protein